MHKIETDTELFELPCKLIMPLQHEFLFKYAVHYGIENNSLTGRLFVKFRIPRKDVIFSKSFQDFGKDWGAHYSQISIEDESIEISDGYSWKQYELKPFFYLTVFEK